MALTEEQKMDVALFRFGLIAPLLNNQVDDSKAYLEMLSSQVFDVPHLGRRDYSSKTFRCWVWDYRRDNIEGLKPQNRSDRGSSRVISPGLGEMIIAFRQDNPALSVKLLLLKPFCAEVFPRWFIWTMVRSIVPRFFTLPVPAWAPWSPMPNPTTPQAKAKLKDILEP